MIYSYGRTWYTTITLITIVTEQQYQILRGVDLKVGYREVESWEIRRRWSHTHTPFDHPVGCDKKKIHRLITTPITPSIATTSSRPIMHPMGGLSDYDKQARSNGATSDRGGWILYVTATGTIESLRKKFSEKNDRQREETCILIVVGFTPPHLRLLSPQAACSSLHLEASTFLSAFVELRSKTAQSDGGSNGCEGSDGTNHTSDADILAVGTNYVDVIATEAGIRTNALSTSAVTFITDSNITARSFPSTLAENFKYFLSLFISHWYFLTLSVWLFALDYSLISNITQAVSTDSCAFSFYWIRSNCAVWGRGHSKEHSTNH